ncbi:hypothetical protein [Nocardia aurantia]|uniref:Anti-sigma-M factor RsmA n=1 Tax=Nocardia aurantia TaxID=2585199 RepID=A0A7K0DMV0_9NOCA|nr:hypothetical protein [Nocardia aurantia]MQY27021.1 hypothetical protein [Nocardia aurantia]
MTARPLPQPPFSPALLADLHADNLAPELSDRLQPLVREDPEAAGFLRSLDDVSTELHRLGTDPLILHPIPPRVSATLDRMLDALAAGADPAALASGRPPAADAAILPLPRRPHVPDRSFSRPRWGVAVAAAAAVAAGGVGVGMATHNRPVASNASPATSTASHPGSAVPSGGLSAAALLDALGRDDVSGPLSRPGALTACVAATGLDRTVLGAVNTRYGSDPAVLILLSGPQPPTVTALVVGPGCGPGDPQLLETRDIG